MKKAVTKSVQKAVPAKATKVAANSTTPKAPSKAVTPTKAPLVQAPQPLATLTSWSYSVYTSYMKCPLSVCFEKIKRIRMVEPPNPAFEKGNAIHKFAEDYISGKLKAAPILPELNSVKERLGKYRKAKAKVEQDWAFTKSFLPTQWNNWADCWLRIKVDVCHEEKQPPLVQITDWKSGRVYEEHKQQRSLYALGGLQLVELGLLADGDKDVKVVAEHLYTDTTQSATETYSMKDLKPLKREWMSRIKQMMSDTRYPAKTGFHCRYCKFRKSNGGPCPEEM